MSQDIFSEEKKKCLPNYSRQPSICTLSCQMFQPLLVCSLVSYGAHSLFGSFSYVISHFLCLCMFFPHQRRIPAGAPVHTRLPLLLSAAIKNTYPCLISTQYPPAKGTDEDLDAVPGCCTPAARCWEKRIVQKHRTICTVHVCD